MPALQQHHHDAATPTTPTRRRRPKIAKRKRARIRLAVYTAYNYTCADCGWKPAEIPDDYDGTYALAGPAPAEALTEPGRHPSQQLAPIRILTLGHKISYRDGGEFTEDNLKAQCSTCNYQKGARTLWPAASAACSPPSGTTRTSGP